MFLMIIASNGCCYRQFFWHVVLKVEGELCAHISFYTNTIDMVLVSNHGKFEKLKKFKNYTCWLLGGL